MRERLRVHLVSTLACAGLLLAFSGCEKGGGEEPPEPPPDGFLLPTNQLLTPVGEQVQVPDWPMAIAVSPDGGEVLVGDSGFLFQKLSIVDVASRAVSAGVVPIEIPRSPSTAVVPNAVFVGLAFTGDGRMAYASGGGLHVVYVLRVDPGSLVKEPVSIRAKGFVVGIALSPDERTLYAALNLEGKLAALDTGSRRQRSSIDTGWSPWAVALHPSGRWVYVTNRGSGTVSQVDTAKFAVAREMRVGAHPTALAIDPQGSRLFVANANSDTLSVLDAETLAPIATLDLLPFEGAKLGGAPNALAISPDGTRLYVALGWDNALAVVEPRSLKVLGYIPTAWYPSAVAVSPDSRTIFAANMKGARTYPRTPKIQPLDYLLNRVAGGYAVPGTLSIIPAPDDRRLKTWSEWVASNNGWKKRIRPGDEEARSAADGSCTPIPCRPGDPTPIEHVVFIVRENKTYDQEFGDMPKGDGDRNLVLYGRNITPNTHALAEQFVLMDNFYADSENSSQAHQWTNGAISPDYVEKTFPTNETARGRPDDSNDPPVKFLTYPETGYLFDNCYVNGVPFRNYGEFVRENADGTKVPYWSENTDLDYPTFDLKVRESVRYEAWKKEFDVGIFPRYVYIWLPNDHTAGTMPGYPSPQYMVAENDFYTGKIVETISHSPEWSKTVIFLVEDDPQSGADHVDSHRTIALIMSPYARRGLVSHERFDIVRMLRTIEDLLGLAPMTRFDSMATPMRSVFTNVPDATPYVALPMTVPETFNTEETPGARESTTLDFSRADSIPDEMLNRILWEAIRKSHWPPPNAKRTRGPGASD